MSVRTTLKTIALTVGSVVAASTVATGVFLFAGRAEIGLNEFVLLSCGVSAAISPPFLFPLIRQTHLLASVSQELDRLARTDFLTGLPNRRDFYERAEALFNDSTRSDSVSVLMIDIDHFKLLNDTFGHAAGDAVLTQVADRIRRTVSRIGSDSAIMGRIGGEEFAIVLSGTAAPAAADIAACLCESVSGQTFEISGTSHAVTLSIGVEALTAAPVFDTAMCRADAAIFKAKAQGRNRWAIAEGSCHDDSANGRLQAA